jgi:hypothetical protein
MKELFLKWLPILGWIVSGGLFSLFIRGLSYSTNAVFGVPKERLQTYIDALPGYLLSGGIFSIMSSLIWTIFVSAGRTHEATILPATICGGFIGFLYRGILKLSPTGTLNGSNGLLLGGLIGGIIGYFGGATGTPGGILPGIFGGMGMAFLGGLWGGVAGLLRHQLTETRLPLLLFEVFIIGTVPGGFFAALFGAVLFDYQVFIVSGSVGAIFGGLFGVVNGLIPSIVSLMTNFFAALFTPLFGMVKFSTVMCGKCFRYSLPFRSQYESGRRFCEHCQQEIGLTQVIGKLVFTFGDLTLTVNNETHTIANPHFELHTLPHRVFVFSNPDFTTLQHPVDVSEMYIDTKTCHVRNLERCITYLVTYPPRDGLHAIRIFHQGTLDELGENLKNTLRNNFKYIEQITSNRWRG